MFQLNFKSIVTVSAILILACFVVGYFLALPSWRKHSDANLQLNQLLTDSEKLNQALKNMQSFLDSFDAQQKNITTVNLALPKNSPDLANFMSSVNDLAAASGVALSDFSIGAQSNPQKAVDKTIQSVTLNLSATGSYPSLKDFILRLQTNLRLINIRHLTLRSTENELLKYQLELETYYQK